MPARDNLDKWGNDIRRILQNAGVAQASIHIERDDKMEQRTFYIDEEEEHSGGTESGEALVYGIASQTKLLTVLLLFIVVDKLSLLQGKKYEKYRRLREVEGNPWQTSFVQLFNRFSKTKISPFPRNPTLLQVALHHNSLPPMNHALLAIDGTPIISKNSFLYVGPHLAERAYNRLEDYIDYSNGNYILLGLFIEAVAEESLAVVMKEHLLDLLKMNHTFMGDPVSSNIRIPHPFIVSADGNRYRVEPSLYPRDSLLGAALGAYSSTADFATLLRNIMACLRDQGLIFTKDQIMDLLKPGIMMPGSTTDKISLFGICTALSTPTAGCRSYNRLISPANICSTYCLGCQHGEKEVMAYYLAGAIKGYTCSSYLVPRRNAFFIVFTNTTGRTDASDHISRLILQKFFDLSLNSKDLASLSLKKSQKELDIHTSDLTKKVVDIVGMSSRAAAEGQNLLDRLTNEDNEEGISNIRPVQLDGVYYCASIQQKIIIEGKIAKIVGTIDNPPHRQPQTFGFIRTGDLSIRLQPQSITGFTIDRYDPNGWKNLTFTLTLGKDANSNDRVVCISRQTLLFLDEFKWTGAAKMVP